MRRPRVTEILAPYSDFSHVSPETLHAAGERGTLAHQFCLAYAAGIFTPDIPEDIQGYVDSYRQWHDRFVIKTLGVEIELIHPVWNYIGHCDLVAIVSGYKSEPVYAIIDLKTPITGSLTWKLQISAYREAEQRKHDDHFFGGVLQIRRDGSLPKMTWLEDEVRAFNAFVGILNGWNYINER